MLALSLASLLNDVASEMVVPLMPAFLSTLTGHGAALLGLVEGLADLVASGLKWGVGRWSDRTGVAKPFILSGYALAAVARPLLSVASAPLHAVVVRSIDRAGKGLRSAPRDALLAASVPAEHRGAAFGLHRSMDHAGAAAGPLVALALIVIWSADLRLIFALALLPGLLSLAAAALSEEIPLPAAAPEAAPSIAAPSGLWRVLLPVALASLGTASDSFLLLKAGVADDAPLTAMPLLWVALHITRTLSAAPGGALADRLSAKGVAALGWSIRALVFLLLALSPSLPFTTAAIVLYGLTSAADGAEKKLVASYAGEGARASAFGAFHAVVGVCALPASLGFGLLWEAFGQEIAFGTASAVVTAAICALLLLAR